MSGCLTCVAFGERNCPTHSPILRYGLYDLTKDPSIFKITTATGANGPATEKPKTPPLRERVNEQVGAILSGAPDDWHGGEELPTPPADLTTYADAFASARKNCPHENYEDVVYAKREAYCTDCRQFFKRPRGLWG